MTTEVAEYKPQVLNVQSVANSYTVASQEDVSAGEELLRNIRDVRRGMDERKTDITRPLMKSLASVRDLFKPLELGLTDAEKTVKSKLLAFSIEHEEAAQKEQERIAKRVEKGTMLPETAAGKMEALSDKKVKTNTRTIEKLVITDETLIPREYMIVNRVAVTEALWAGVQVPGAEMRKEKIIAVK